MSGSFSSDEEASVRKASPKSKSTDPFITVSRSIRQITLSFLSNRKLLILVSLCVTRAGILPDFINWPTSNILCFRELIFSISWPASLLLPGSDDRNAFSKLLILKATSWNPVMVSFRGGSGKSIKFRWNVAMALPVSYAFFSFIWSGPVLSFLQ